jgi:hypothetical protein
LTQGSDTFWMDGVALDNPLAIEPDGGIAQVIYLVV